MTAARVEFAVHGSPRPQGSKRAWVHGGRAVMVETSRGLPTWRDNVRAAALTASPTPYPFGDRAVRVDITFHFARPKAHFRAGRYSHELRAGAPTSPATRSTPDVDKCARAVLDALVDAAVLRDDSQVVDLCAAKRWAREAPGALIIVEPAP